MHEMSRAVELVRQLEALAADHRVERIEEVTVRTGVMLQVVPEANDTIALDNRRRM